MVVAAFLAGMAVGILAMIGLAAGFAGDVEGR
jgi:hypothetical protein